MERKCQEMLKVLEENNTAIFEDIINVIRDNSEKFDMTDRKLFERKETTDNLKKAITPIIEKYNSANPETRAKTKQISLFD